MMFLPDKNGAFELILGSALIKMDALQPQNMKFVAFYGEKKDREQKLLEFSDNFDNKTTSLHNIRLCIPCHEI